MNPRLSSSLIRPRKASVPRPRPRAATHAAPKHRPARYRGHHVHRRQEPHGFQASQRPRVERRRP